MIDDHDYRIPIQWFQRKKNTGTDLLPWVAIAHICCFLLFSNSNRKTSLLICRQKQWVAIEKSFRLARGAFQSHQFRWSREATNSTNPNTYRQFDWHLVDDKADMIHSSNFKLEDSALRNSKSSTENKQSYVNKKQLYLPHTTTTTTVSENEKKEVSKRQCAMCMHCAVLGQSLCMFDCNESNGPLIDHWFNFHILGPTFATAFGRFVWFSY